MSKRRFFTLSVGFAGILAAASLGVSAMTAQAIPPEIYNNGSVAAIKSFCIAETETCAASEKAELRSAYVPIIAWGKILLKSEGLGAEGVTCTNTFTGKTWNEHEHGVKTNPIRGYGVAEGWGTSTCAAPEFIKKYKAACKCEPTIFASAERPLEYEYREARICKKKLFEEGKKLLSECPDETERETEALYSAVKRKTVSLPWKIELVRGYPESGHSESVVQQRIGVHSYGECGPGPAEGTPTCEGAKENTDCYSKQSETENYSYEEIPTGCVVTNIVIPQVPVEIPFFGTLEVTGRNGAGSGIDPSKIEFEGAFSGKLQSNADQEGSGTVSDSVKELGEEGQGLITAK